MLANYHSTYCIGAVAHSFESFLKHSRDSTDFNDYSVIILDNGSHNYDDIFARIIEMASCIFTAFPLITLCCRDKLSITHFLQCLQHISSSNPGAKIFTITPNKDFDLQKVMLPLKHCFECEGLYDGPKCVCNGNGGVPDYFDDVPCTYLPVAIPAFEIKPNCILVSLCSCCGTIVHRKIRLKST